MGLAELENTIGGVQPVDATPFPSDLTRWNGMHMAGMDEHGSRQSRRLSSGSAERAATGWQTSSERSRNESCV